MNSKFFKSNFLNFQSFCFSLGIFSGIFLGINLRDKGFSKFITKLFFALQEDDFGKSKNINKPHATIEDAYHLFYNGKLEGERLEVFIKMGDKKRFDQEDLDFVCDRDPLAKFKHPKYHDYRSEFNAFDYKKYLRNKKNNDLVDRDYSNVVKD